MEKGRKHGGWFRIIFILAVIVAIGSLPGCKHSAGFDFTFPEITIRSPEDGVIYDTTMVVLDYTIKEANFKDAWFILNDGEMVGIPQNGSRKLTLDNGAYKLVLVAVDQSNNTSGDSLQFFVDTNQGLHLSGRSDGTTGDIIENGNGF